MRRSLLLLLAAALALSALAAMAPQTEAPKTFALGEDKATFPKNDGVPAYAQRQENNEPDKTEMILITLGIVAGAAVLALIGYAIRLRVGFWPHRPPPRDAGAPEEHH
jgi:hypothetical protein